MEHKKEKRGIINTLSWILFGVFSACVILAILTQSFSEYGLWLSLIVLLFLIFCGFYYVKKGTILRLMTWGATITLVSGTILFIAFTIILSSALEGF